VSEGFHIRVAGRAGRITLDRPQALNALTYDMIRAIDAALADWAADDRIALVIVDAVGEKAFCAGGDVAEIHAAGRAGDYAGARRFWADEYRMNARIAGYPKPIVALMQGYTMGGGVGLGGHASHRIVGTTSRMAMPEVGIGMMPDVGGSFLLARAPGRLGEYLACAAARMGPGDAIRAGFADAFVPEPGWPALIAEMEKTGDPAALAPAAAPTPEAALAPLRAEIDTLFAGESLAEIVAALRTAQTDFAADTLATMARHSPLAMACAVAAIRQARSATDIRAALELEYRFVHRAIAEGDILEGVRAAIIDKDRSPRWRHADPAAVGEAEVARMLAPLGPEGWTPPKNQEASP